MLIVTQHVVLRYPIGGISGRICRCPIWYGHFCLSFLCCAPDAAQHSHRSVRGTSLRLVDDMPGTPGRFRRNTQAGKALCYALIWAVLDLDIFIYNKITRIDCHSVWPVHPAHVSFTYLMWRSFFESVIEVEG